MTNEIKLTPKKERKRFSDLFKDKKKRYPLMFLLMLPFIIGIIVFSTIIYREVKNILAIKNGPAETRQENIIQPSEGINYILRDNATDVQKEYFAQLKAAIEESETRDFEAIAKLIAQNYIADFYTWTNKQGQYDVGGMYYVYNGEYLDGEHFRDNVYQKARDGFYKYMSYYLNKYGLENLIEVESVEVTRCVKLKDKYLINEHVAYKQNEKEEWYDYREDFFYDGYSMTCSWKYKDVTGLNTSQFANTLNLIVIDVNDAYYVVETGENILNGRTKKESSDTTSQDEKQEGEEGSESQSESN